MIKNLKIKALKDKDFLDLQSKSNENLINISKENAITLFTTIKKDLNLLSKANLMDYSLHCWVLHQCKIDVNLLLSS